MEREIWAVLRSARMKHSDSPAPPPSSGHRPDLPRPTLARGMLLFLTLALPGLWRSCGSVPQGLLHPLAGRRQMSWESARYCLGCGRLSIKLLLPWPPPPAPFCFSFSLGHSPGDDVAPTQRGCIGAAP